MATKELIQIPQISVSGTSKSDSVNCHRLGSLEFVVLEVYISKIVTFKPRP